MSKPEAGVPQVQAEPSKNWKHITKLAFYSFVGIFMFFIPITINGNTSIPLDHIVTWTRTPFHFRSILYTDYNCTRFSISVYEWYVEAKQSKCCYVYF